MTMTPTTSYPALRQGHVAEKIVFTDGLWGCGKTMLSPIIAALDRVELLSFCYELEYTCSLHHMNRITDDAAIAMARLLTDLKIYSQLMSRDVNYRFRDLSSVFMNPKPWRYIKRLFEKDEKKVPQTIKENKPILNLATHNILAFSDPIFKGLEERVVFVELIRHPLYMVKQIALNMKNLINTPRHMTIYFEHKGKTLPYFYAGHEEKFLDSSNPMDQAIYYIELMTKLTEAKKAELNKKHSEQIITIPFEIFVIDPMPWMLRIEKALETEITSTTRREMKKQKVPRTLISDGISLKIYKRCGWEAPKTDSNEAEFDLRRSFAKEQASPKAMKVLDEICEVYEATHLSGEALKKAS